MRTSKNQRNKYCSQKCYWETLKRKTGEKANQWKGGGKKHSYGYILLYKPEDVGIRYPYVAEHRLIMEKHIGRPLTRKEIVHHINGIKTDNRIKNLVLCSGNKEHRIYHTKMEAFVYKLVQENKAYYDKKEKQYKLYYLYLLI